MENHKYAGYVTN